MKPTKNRVFCRDCGRKKMLFDTEKRANNFIAFNQEEIKAETGVAPQRSYYCIFCAGWHVTSIKEDIGISKNEILIDEYLKDKAKSKKETSLKHEEKKDRFKMELENKISKIDANQLEIFFSETVKLLNEEIEKLKHTNEIKEIEKLKDFRLNLHVVYMVKKQYGFCKDNKPNKRYSEQELEEWRLWIEKKDCDNK